jgi:glycosyltransferase involved in cell wall biosynthesis
MISAIIPSRNERFLNQTIQSLLENAVGEIEVIAIIDESWPEKVIKDNRVIYIHFGSPRGMRAGVNAGLSVVHGQYIMKTDGHCLFAPGFDKVLAENCEENWLVIPRRYSLDAEAWTIDKGRPFRDYHYLCFPAKGKPHDWGMHGVEWPERTRARSDPKYDIDDTMSFQGSLWFANRDYFMKHVGFLDDRTDTYSTFAQEPQEVGLKYWLGGGVIKVNKKTWYAHLHKGRHWGRMYREDPNTVASHNWSAKHWMEGKEPGMIHPISWLVEKFWPVPTWPEDRSLWVSPI